MNICTTSISNLWQLRNFSLSVPSKSYFLRTLSAAFAAAHQVMFATKQWKEVKEKEVLS